MATETPESRVIETTLRFTERSRAMILRSEWIAADVPGVGEVRMMSGAGLGTPAVTFEFKNADGETEAWVGDISEVFRAFVDARFPEPVR
jgi:hypothetical protein